MSERELVKAAQAGDFNAFNRLISGYREKIYRLALKLTGNRHDAEDIMQETFLKAVDNLDKFRGEASFGTWLYTIAMNVFRAETVSAKKMELKPIEEQITMLSRQADHAFDGLRDDTSNQNERAGHRGIGAGAEMAFLNSHGACRISPRSGHL